MNRYGCVGKKLTHSFSKEIHAKLADYAYELIELSEEELTSFFTQKEFCAVNVTIPYKQAVLPLVDECSPAVQAIGAANTIFRKDGKLCAENTDIPGFRYMAERSGIPIEGRKVLVLGNGGASKAVEKQNIRKNSQNEMIFGCFCYQIGRKTL